MASWYNSNHNIVFRNDYNILILIHHILYMYIRANARHFVQNYNFEYHHTSKEAFNAPAVLAAAAAAAVRDATESWKPDVVARLAGCGYIG